MNTTSFRNYIQIFPPMLTFIVDSEYKPLKPSNLNITNVSNIPLRIKIKSNATQYFSLVPPNFQLLKNEKIDVVISPLYRGLPKRNNPKPEYVFLLEVYDNSSNLNENIESNLKLPLLEAIKVRSQVIIQVQKSQENIPFINPMLEIDKNEEFKRAQTIINPLTGSTELTQSKIVNQVKNSMIANFEEKDKQISEAEFNVLETKMKSLMRTYNESREEAIRIKNECDEIRNKIKGSQVKKSETSSILQNKNGFTLRFIFLISFLCLLLGYLVAIDF